MADPSEDLRVVLDPIRLAVIGHANREKAGHDELAALLGVSRRDPEAGL